MPTKVLLLEFNEICPALLERWLPGGNLPNFKRLYDESEVFISLADDTNPSNLEPWIQWFSIHTGVPYAEHRVFHLTDGPRSDRKDIWWLVLEAGKSAMNCSSMNAKRFTGERAFFLPDPWCPPESSFPDDLVAYSKVVSAIVQEYSNARIPLTLRDYLAFSRFMASHGLRPATVTAVAKQLATETLFSRDISWRRATLLDRLQYDLFAHYYRELKPDFATFFSNSTAHLQHAYWRHMDPIPFSIKPSPEERATYGGAVFFGYKAMDRLIGRLLRLVDKQTIVILCSALSQQPFIKWDDRGGQHFYRVRELSKLFALLGMSPTHVESVMTHQYVVHFGDATDAESGVSKLRALCVAGEPLCGIERASANSLKFGCQLFMEIAGEELITGIADLNRPLRFDELFYPIRGTKSGSHHPEGVLWIRTGLHHVRSERVSILDIAPTVCDLLDISTTWPGRSLIARGGADVRANNSVLTAA